MKIRVVKGAIEKAPKGVVRVRATARAEEEGLVREGSTETLLVYAPAPHTLRTLRLFVRRVVVEAKKRRVTKLALSLTAAEVKALRVEAEAVARQVAENMVLAHFEFTDFKTRPKEGWPVVEEVMIVTDLPGLDKAVEQGRVVGEGVNACRRLANTPGGDMTPTTLAKAAKTAVKGLPVGVEVLGPSVMKKLGMGAVLGVAKGSDEAPAFITLDYKGGSGAPIVLAGKGVTFDSGGLNVKSESGMYEMHMDMAGAAAVIHAVALAARLKVKAHVIGLVPAVENMSGGSAYRPGDILKSLSGKTIEVLNTDAEGRLILADALTYAKRFAPGAVIDVATLTGAALVALGTHANALLTRDDTLAHELLESAEASGDYLWRLPLWDEYEESVKSHFADVANVPGNSGASRYGGCINGGMFLWQFAKELDCPWAHVDIAPRMTPASSEHLAKGATGTGVRLLLHYIERYAISYQDRKLRGALRTRP